MRRLLDGARRRRRGIEDRGELRELQAQGRPGEEGLALVSLRGPIDRDALREGRASR